VAIEPSDEDASGYSFPQKPSELRELSDDEFHKLWRKIAFANKWTYDRIVEFELTIRLTKSLEDFKRASDRASSWVIGLTVMLVVLTIVIAALTVALVVLTVRLD
jgi:hypothetical protein